MGCTTCWSDSTLTDKNGSDVNDPVQDGVGYCGCDDVDGTDAFRMVLWVTGTRAYDSVERLCRVGKTCPSFYTYNDAVVHDGQGNTCYILTTDTASGFRVTFAAGTEQDFSTDITDTNRDTDIEYVSCNPPWYHGQYRGYYFDGVQHSLDFDKWYTNFVDSTFMLVIRPRKFDVTLLYFELEQTDGIAGENSYFEMWIDECGYFNVNICGELGRSSYITTVDLWAAVYFTA